MKCPSSTQVTNYNIIYFISFFLLDSIFSYELVRESLNNVLIGLSVGWHFPEPSQCGIRAVISSLWWAKQEIARCYEGTEIMCYSKIIIKNIAYK